MPIPPQVFWPYFAGAAALATGVLFKARRFKQARGSQALLVAAPVFVAIGMAVFGADHLTAIAGVATIVPRWIPWHEFWAGFVGVALEAAALSLSIGVLSDLAVGLLGGMLVCFALLIFIPFWLGAPGDRTRFTLLVRDSSLGTAYLAFALRGARGAAGRAVAGAGRFVLAVGMGIYGIFQLLHPKAAPGFPQEGPTLQSLPSWVPAHAFWTYLSGVIFLACSVGLLVRKAARRSAFFLGATVTVLTVAAYLPITIERGRDVDNGLNYLAIHCVLAGALLLLSVALSEPTEPGPPRAERRSGSQN